MVFSGFINGVPNGHQTSQCLTSWNHPQIWCYHQPGFWCAGKVGWKSDFYPQKMGWFHYVSPSEHSGHSLRATESNVSIAACRWSVGRTGCRWLQSPPAAVICKDHYGITGFDNRLAQSKIIIDNLPHSISDSSSDTFGIEMDWIHILSYIIIHFWLFGLFFFQHSPTWLVPWSNGNCVMDPQWPSHGPGKWPYCSSLRKVVLHPILIALVMYTHILLIIYPYYDPIIPIVCLWKC